MPYGIFVTAHGGRGTGTAKGTYCVPPGANLKFFTDDAVLLKGNIGMAIEDRLTRPALDLDVVRGAVQKTSDPFETIPNYTAFGSHNGDPAFQFQTGVYYIGSQKNDPPAMALNHGQQIRLSEIIAAFKKANGSVPAEVYWLCCRAVPQNSNNAEEVDATFFGSMQKAKDMGLKPSQVVAKGGSWR